MNLNNLFQFSRVYSVELLFFNMLLRLRFILLLSYYVKLLFFDKRCIEQDINSYCCSLSGTSIENIIVTSCIIIKCKRC